MAQDGDVEVPKGGPKGGNLSLFELQSHTDRVRVEGQPQLSAPVGEHFGAVSWVRFGHGRPGGCTGAQFGAEARAFAASQCRDRPGGEGLGKKSGGAQGSQGEARCAQGRFFGHVRTYLGLGSVGTRGVVRSKERRELSSGFVEQLVIFARFPSPGGAKTRLIPALGPEGAADLERQMTEHTLSFADRLAARRAGLAVRLHSTGGTAHQFQQLYGERRRSTDQGEGTLGERLERAFGYSLLFGAHRVVVVRTDAPELDDRYMETAFEALADHELVLGPATDGGYVLIGLSRHAPELFRGISWRTPDLAQWTLARAAELELRVQLLPTLQDVDEPQDLDAWERRTRA